MPKSTLFPCVIILLVASGIAFASAPRPTQGTSGELHADLVAGSPSETSVRHTFTLNTRQLAERVATEEVLSLPLDANRAVTLALEEREIFAPGQKKVQYFDDAGRVVREEPILARTFLGTVIETGEPAEATIAPEGVYAVVRYQGIDYSFQPLSWSSGIVVQEVVHDAISEALPGLRIPDLAPRAMEPSEASAFLKRALVVRPVAEPAFRSWTSDWANRITNGYFYAVSMWDTETNIDIILWSAAAPSTNFASHATLICGAPGTKDLGLNAFHNWVRTSGETGVNSYGLWHGVDGVSNQAGCANINCNGTPSGCLQATSATTPNTSATHAVQAKDLFSTDNYDATRTDHLGKAAAHELTHNAGEPDHPGDGSCWFSNTYNLMANVGTMGCRGTWRTSGTISRVNSYAPQYLETAY